MIWSETTIFICGWNDKDICRNFANHEKIKQLKPSIIFTWSHYKLNKKVYLKLRYPKGKQINGN